MNHQVCWNGQKMERGVQNLLSFYFVTDTMCYAGPLHAVSFNLKRRVNCSHFTVLETGPKLHTQGLEIHTHTHLSMPKYSLPPGTEMTHVKVASGGFC